MLHKLRDAMGKRDGEYMLAGRMDPDEGYFYHLQCFSKTQKFVVENLHISNIARIFVSIILINDFML